MVETLKKLRNILLGQQIKVHTDHKNLTYKSFTTERVMRSEPILEEFSLELIYIKGSKYIVVDDVNRLDKIYNLNKSSTKTNNIHNFALNKQDVIQNYFKIPTKG